MAKIPFKALLKKLKPRTHQMRSNAIVQDTGKVFTRSVTGNIMLSSAKPEKNVEDITKLTHELNDWYLKTRHRTPEEINYGWCYNWAKKMQDQVGGAVVGTESGGHWWLYWKGKYYDSQIPNGTKFVEHVPHNLRKRYGALWGDEQLANQHKKVETQLYMATKKK